MIIKIAGFDYGLASQIDVNLKICFQLNKHIEKHFQFTFHLASNGL